MGVTAAETQKRPYKNQTAGWLGVVKLSHLGAQEGTSVAPYGTVWLSDDEAILTARAPAQAKDNPFVEQPFMFEDAQGNRVEQQMAPLVLIEDDREVPGEGADRFVPTHLAGPVEAKIAADAIDTQRVLDDESERPVAETPVEPKLVPSSQAAVPPSHATRTGPIPTGVPQAPEDDVSGEEQRQSWTENPDRTEQPQTGALGGSNEHPGPQEGVDNGPVGGASPAATAAVDPAHTTPGAVSPQNAGTVPSESAGTGDQAGAPSEQGGEEHAAVTDSGEETGAAATPAGQAPEGEFAQHEEVGSPDAPQQAQGESA